MQIRRHCDAADKMMCEARLSFITSLTYNASNNLIVFSPPTGQSNVTKPVGVQPSDGMPTGSPSPTGTTTPGVVPVTPPAVSQASASIVAPLQPTASSTPVAASRPSDQPAPVAAFGNTTLSSLLQTQSAKVVGDDNAKPAPQPPAGGVDEAGTGKATTTGLFGQTAKPASSGLFGAVAGKQVGTAQPVGEDEAGTGLPSPPVIAEATDSNKLPPAVSSGAAASTAPSGFSFGSKPSATGTSLAGLLGAPSASSGATVSGPQTQAPSGTGIILVCN